MIGKIPIGIYSDDGEQGWNFNAQINFLDPTVGQVYEAAIECVSKQMLNRTEKRQRDFDLQSGKQSYFDLIGGNKILLFMQKEVSLQ